MELAEGELAALLEEMLAKCLGYAAPREALGCLRATPWDFEKKVVVAMIFLRYS